MGYYYFSYTDYCFEYVNDTGCAEGCSVCGDQYNDDNSALEYT